MERGHRGLIVGLLLAAAPARALTPAAPARPDGDPPAHGSQRLGVAAVRQAHAQFSADGCLVAVDVMAQRVVDPKLPPEDTFTFLFRSPSLFKMKWEASICLPNAAGAKDPRCVGEWEVREARAFDSVRCFPAKIVDSGEALAVAVKNGLPKAPVDGLRLSLRLVPKAGPGLARQPRLKGRPVWILESRDECHAIDALTLAALHKGRCSKFPWP